MKNLKTYILALGMVGLGACNDKFLDTEPSTQLTDANYFKTPKDGFTALVGCYDGLQVVWASGISLPVASEVFSDDAFGGTGNSDGFGYQMIDEFDKSRSPGDVNTFGDNWTAYYKGIYRSNVLIGKLDQIDWGTQIDLRKTYESEARFLRAYLYFDMVRLWGNIPLITTPTSANVPQANPDDVYKVIASDLKFAADNLASVTYTAQPVSTHGRVTKWAAESLLARVYLYYTGYYGKTDLVGEVTKAQTLTYLEDVIANSGHDLLTNYADLWPAASPTDYAGEDNQETVFAIKFTYTSDYNGNTDGNHWMVMNGLRGLNSYPYGQGWGGATVNPKTWNMFDNNDTRKVASIISIDDEGIPFDATSQADQREYTAYFNKKYTPMSDASGNSVATNAGGVNFQIGQFEDYVSIRYADVLLMAAELGSANAQTYLDKVRQRAFKANFASIPVSPANIMNERHLEFVGEGIRYWDLLRQGVSVASSTIAETTTLKNGGTPTTVKIDAANIQLTNGLQQIPSNQITLSGGVLKQNTGW